MSFEFLLFLEKRRFSDAYRDRSQITMTDYGSGAEVAVIQADEAKRLNAS